MHYLRPRYSAVYQYQKTGEFLHSIEYNMYYRLEDLSPESMRKLQSMIKGRIGTSVLGGLGQLFWAFHAACNAKFCATLDSNNLMSVDFPQTHEGEQHRAELLRRLEPYAAIAQGEVQATQPDCLDGWGSVSMTCNLRKQSRPFWRTLLYDVTGTTVNDTRLMLEKLRQRPIIKIHHFSGPRNKLGHPYWNQRQHWPFRIFSFID